MKLIKHQCTLPERKEVSRHTIGTSSKTKSFSRLYLHALGQTLRRMVFETPFYSQWLQLELSVWYLASRLVLNPYLLPSISAVGALVLTVSGTRRMWLTLCLSNSICAVVMSRTAWVLMTSLLRSISKFKL